MRVEAGAEKFTRHEILSRKRKILQRVSDAGTE